MTLVKYENLTFHEEDIISQNYEKSSLFCSIDVPDVSKLSLDKDTLEKILDQAEKNTDKKSWFEIVSKNISDSKDQAYFLFNLKSAFTKAGEGYFSTFGLDDSELKKLNKLYPQNTLQKNTVVLKEIISGVMKEKKELDNKINKINADYQNAKRTVMALTHQKESVEKQLKALEETHKTIKTKTSDEKSKLTKEETVLKNSIEEFDKKLKKAKNDLDRLEKEKNGTINARNEFNKKNHIETIKTMVTGVLEN